jgi:hypothetical protein
MSNRKVSQDQRKVSPTRKTEFRAGKFFCDGDEFFKERIFRFTFCRVLFEHFVEMTFSLTTVVSLFSFFAKRASDLVATAQKIANDERGTQML